MRTFVPLLLLTLIASLTPARGQDASAYTEPLRPQFHFTAAKNWLNDPNGMVYYAGVYHLFFQYNPRSRESAFKSWGHATSPDMIHWTQQDTVLFPDDLGEIWSGSGVVDTASPTAAWSLPATTSSPSPIVLIYTAAGKTFSQCLAISTDAGKTFHKYDHNPVISQIRPGNRDPKVIWHAPTKRWIVALYLDGNDFAFLSSPDLKTWTKTQEIHVPGSSECPDFFEMPVENDPGKTAWLWTSANAKYLVGTFDGNTFHPDHGFEPIQNEYGRNFYAAQTFSDTPDSRRIQIAWMRDGQYPGMPFNQQMSFPAELKLRRTLQGLHLFREPIAELEKLHDTPFKLSDVELNDAGTKLNLTTDLLDVRLLIDLQSATRIILRIRSQEVTYDAPTQTLSSLGAKAPLTPEAGKISLRLLLDRTSLELFANGGAVSMSSCFLPDGKSSDVPTISATGGTARLISCDAYTLKSAWK